MKPTNEDLVNLLVIWSQEVYVRGATSGTWDDPRTKEATLIVNTIKRQILELMSDTDILAVGHDY